jgi:hypothetical protein
MIDTRPTPDPYLAELADDGDTIIEPRPGWRLTVLGDGGLVLEFLETHLAIRLPGPDACSDLTAAIADARAREAEGLTDDAALYPHDVPDRP